MTTVDSGRRGTTHGGPAPAHETQAPARLALVVSSLAAGGTERVAATLGDAWTSLGSEVTLVTLSGVRDDFYRVGPGTSRVALDLRADRPGMVDPLLNNARRVLRVLRALRRARPDAVVSFGDTTNLIASVAAMALRIPLVVSERTDPRHYPLAGHVHALRRMLYPRAGAVVVQTESVRAWALSFLRPDRVHVIPNPVAAPDLVPAAAGREQAGTRTLVAMGRLVPLKGFDTLVEAFARCAAHQPGWTLCIIGDGPERDRLQALAAARGLTGRVRLPGSCSSPAELLAASDLFALTSRFEGFPNALLEAMAVGLPAVSFDCPSGPRDIVRDGVDGILVAPGDTAALARALARLMSDDAERRRMGLAARGVLERFSVERILSLWGTVFAAVTRRRSAAQAGSN